MTDKLPCKKAGANKKNVFSTFFASLSKKPLLLVVIVAVLTIVITSMVSILLINSGSHLYLPSFATVKTVDVEVFWDEHCENKTELVTWDELEVGKSVNKTVYVKSVSNVMITLNTHLTDWNPEEISKYLTFSTNYTNQNFSPNEVIPITLFLSAPSSDELVYYLIDNEIQTFDFAIHFVGSG